MWLPNGTLCDLRLDQTTVALYTEKVRRSPNKNNNAMKHPRPLSLRDDALKTKIKKSEQCQYES